MSAPAESISLTVTLAGRPYPLRVLPEDEGPITRIARELNDKLGDFLQAYDGKDRQDCLAMLLLIYAVDLYKVKEGTQADAGARADVGAQADAGAQATGARLLESLRRLEAQLADALEAVATPADDTLVGGLGSPHSA